MEGPKSGKQSEKHLAWVSGHGLEGTPEGWEGSEQRAGIQLRWEGLSWGG